MRDVHLTLGQHRARVHVGDDPRRGRSVGRSHIADRLDDGLCLGHGTAVSDSGATDTDSMLRHAATTTKNLPMGLAP